MNIEITHGTACFKWHSLDEGAFEIEFTHEVEIEYKAKIPAKGETYTDTDVQLTSCYIDGCCNDKYLDICRQNQSLIDAIVEWLCNHQIEIEESMKEDFILSQHPHYEEGSY